MQTELHLDKLTKGQRDVLSLVTDGRTNKQIARVLRLAEITVKVRLTAIYRKLGVINRAQAVRFVYDPPRLAVNGRLQCRACGHVLGAYPSSQGDTSHIVRPFQ